MSTQFLFAYGTLKSDQPEHAQHCVPPLSIVKAKTPGFLWKLREGYPILQINPDNALLDATSNPASDWLEACQMEGSALEADEDEKWIEGELFEYPIESKALDKMDRWENFVPGVKSPYQRRIIRILDAEGNLRIAWAYVCYSPPDWATLLDSVSWQADA